MSVFELGRSEVAKRTRLGVAFPTKGIRFHYEYDMGTTTALEGRVVGFREGSLGRAGVRLLARNTAPEWGCSECVAAATVVCNACDDGPLLCDAHSARHPCAEEEGFLPVVNSPRMGMCGYTGA